MLIKLTAVAALSASAAVAAYRYSIPVPGAGEVRVEVTTLTVPKGWTAADSGQITGSETKKAFTHASAMATAATNRVTTWTVTKTKTNTTVNGVPGKAAVGDVCNFHVTTPPYADKITCARP